eukprot:8530403-Ditylum_brightwellii.AAC.1
MVYSTPAIPSALLSKEMIDVSCIWHWEGSITLSFDAPPSGEVKEPISFLNVPNWPKANSSSCSISHAVGWVRVLMQLAIGSK